jgi:hypothetical protein
MGLPWQKWQSNAATISRFQILQNPTQIGNSRACAAGRHARGSLKTRKFFGVFAFVRILISAPKSRGNARSVGALPSIFRSTPETDIAPIFGIVRALPIGLIGTTATSERLVAAVPDRREAHIFGIRSAMGCGITGLRRSNIAHHRRS